MSKFVVDLTAPGSSYENPIDLDSNEATKWNKKRTLCMHTTGQEKRYKHLLFMIQIETCFIFRIMAFGSIKMGLFK